MALLKYGNNLIGNGTSLLKYESAIPVDNFGYWRHYQTGVYTSLAEFFPDYTTESPVAFNGYNDEGVGGYAENIGELKLKEGCEVVRNIGLLNHPTRLVTLYEHLTILDLPTTITAIGTSSSTMFNGLANVTQIIVRALTPPDLYIGAIQSPNAKLYVPDGSVNGYKAAPVWSSYSALILPISDIE